MLGDIASVNRYPRRHLRHRRRDEPGVHLRDGHTQDEQILDYSPWKRSYRYLIEGAPLPVTDNSGSLAEEVDGVSRVVWESSFEPVDETMGAQLAEMWEPYLPMTLANLKRVVDWADQA